MNTKKSSSDEGSKNLCELTGKNLIISPQSTNFEGVVVSMRTSEDTVIGSPETYELITEGPLVLENWPRKMGSVKVNGHPKVGLNYQLWVQAVPTSTAANNETKLIGQFHFTAEELAKAFGMEKPNPNEPINIDSENAAPSSESPSQATPAAEQAVGKATEGTPVSEAVTQVQTTVSTQEATTQTDDTKSAPTVEKPKMFKEDVEYLKQWLRNLEKTIELARSLKKLRVVTKGLNDISSDLGRFKVKYDDKIITEFEQCVVLVNYKAEQKKTQLLTEAEERRRTEQTKQNEGLRRNEAARVAEEQRKADILRDEKEKQEREMTANADKVKVLADLTQEKLAKAERKADTAREKAENAKRESTANKATAESETDVIEKIAEVERQAEARIAAVQKDAENRVAAALEKLEAAARTQEQSWRREEAARVREAATAQPAAATEHRVLIDVRAQQPEPKEPAAAKLPPVVETEGPKRRSRESASKVSTPFRIPGWLPGLLLALIALAALFYFWPDIQERLRSTTPPVITDSATNSNRNAVNSDALGTPKSVTMPQSFSMNSNTIGDGNVLNFGIMECQHKPCNHTCKEPAQKAPLPEVSAPAPAAPQELPRKRADHPEGFEPTCQITISLVNTERGISMEQPGTENFRTVQPGEVVHIINDVASEYKVVWYNKDKSFFVQQGSADAGFNDNSDSSVIVPYPGKAADTLNYFFKVRGNQPAVLSFWVIKR